MSTPEQPETARAEAERLRRLIVEMRFVGSHRANEWADELDALLAEREAAASASVPEGWEHVADIVYNHKTEKIEYRRPGQEGAEREPEPSALAEKPDKS